MQARTSADVSVVKPEWKVSLAADAAYYYSTLLSKKQLRIVGS